jgi:hypothetical protein
VNCFSRVSSACRRVNRTVLVRKQVGDSYFKRLGERRDHDERRIPLAALHAADIGPVAARLGGQLLLAPAALLAELSHPQAKFFLDGLHPRIEAGCSL